MDKYGFNDQCKRFIVSTGGLGIGANRALRAQVPTQNELCSYI